MAQPDAGTTASPEAASGPAHQRHVQTMARAGGLSMVGAVVSALAQIALTALITNGFEKGVAGTIFATTSLFLIVTAVAQLGTEVGLVRALPVLIVQGRRKDLGAVLRVALLPVVGVAVVGTAVGLVAAPQLAHLVAPDADPGLLTAELRALAVFVPVVAVYNVMLAATRGLRTMVPTVTVESLGRSAGQLVAVGAAQVLGLGAVGVLLAWSAPFAIGLVVATLWIAALLRHRPQHDDLPNTDGDAQSNQRRAMVEFWRFTAPRAIGTASQMALKRADIVLVAALRSPREAALYAAASRFVVVGQLGVQALQQALSPHLSALFAREDHHSAREVYRATTAWSMLMSWPVYLICAVMAPELLRVFGRGYDNVAPVVVVLSIAMLASTACGAVDAVLLMSGHSWLSFVNNVSALLIDLGLNVVLIPSHGALGAGVSWMVAILVRNLLPLAQIAVKYRISPLGHESVLAAASSLACFGVLPLSARLLGGTTSWMLTALVLGTLLYAVTLWKGQRVLRLHAFRGVLRSRGSRSAGAAAAAWADSSG